MNEFLRRVTLSRQRAAACLALLGFLFTAGGAHAAAGPKDAATANPAKEHASIPDSDTFFNAIVKVEVKAVAGARSNATLGPQRSGTGVVIGKDGLILTIGYLIVEADQVTIIDQKGRPRPARVVGYDHATGFGLVRSIAPFDVDPIPLGDSESLREREPVMIVNYSGKDEVNLAYVVSRRMFTGNWEYMLESAIFTAPPTMNWSGAALVGKDGRLLGVGSLIVRDATEGERQLPGNMFVPVEILKPILADLVKSGRRAGQARPWLGMAADEVQGRLFVTRVSPGGPAEAAGIRSGDILLGVGSQTVKSQADFYRRLWSVGEAGSAITLKVLQGSDVREINVQSIDRVDYFKAKQSY